MNWFSDPETNLSLSTIFIFLVFWYDFSLFFFLSSLLSPFWTSWFKLKPPLPTISLSKAKFLSQDFYLISYHAFLFIGMEEGSRTFLGGTSMFLDFHGSILAIQHFCTTCWVGYFSTCFLPP